MYDKEELEIVDYIEKENPSSVTNLRSEIDMIKASVTQKCTKRNKVL